MDGHCIIGSYKNHTLNFRCTGFGITDEEPVAIYHILMDMIYNG